MSDQSHPPATRAEPDRIGTPRILAVGVSALILFAVASWFTIRFGYDRTRAQVLADGPAAPPSEIGRNKIGIVEQRLFELAVEPAGGARSRSSGSTGGAGSTARRA